MAAVLFAACGSPYYCLGKSYPPTYDPGLFFRAQYAQKEYEIMGKLQAELPSKYAWKNSEALDE